MEYGSKITVDSATLMNKGLEIIEAHHLFNMPYDKIDVVVHPQSIVHSAIEYKDGSVIAQIGLPSMHIPIQYAITYPERFEGIKSKVSVFQKSQDLILKNRIIKNSRHLILHIQQAKSAAVQLFA